MTRSEQVLTIVSDTWKDTLEVTDQVVATFNWHHPGMATRDWRGDVYDCLCELEDQGLVERESHEWVSFTPYRWRLARCSDLARS